MDAVLAAAIVTPPVVLLVAVLIGRWMRSADRAQEQQRTGAVPPSEVPAERRPEIAPARPQESVPESVPARFADGN